MIYTDEVTNGIVLTYFISISLYLWTSFKNEIIHSQDYLCTCRNRYWNIFLQLIFFCFVLFFHFQQPPVYLMAETREFLRNSQNFCTGKFTFISLSLGLSYIVRPQINCIFNLVKNVNMLLHVIKTCQKGNRWVGSEQNNTQGKISPFSLL